MNETQQLLQEIEAFLASSGMAASTFGRKSVNDGKLVLRLRAGSTVTIEKAARIRAYVREYVPSRAPAPASRTEAHA